MTAATAATAENKQRADNRIAPPQALLTLLASITGAGYEAFLVGGCVRDWLLGREPHDFDVATAASPEAIFGLFPRVVATGERFGGVTVLCGHLPVEVTTYRTEQGYADGRHPDAVSQAATLREDVQRRDFTIGALAWSPQTGLVDYIGGGEDLKAGIIRAVGDPARRFAEDHLRILRAVRFAAQLGFIIEPATRCAMLKAAQQIKTVSRERIGRELALILQSPQPQLIGVLADAGALTWLGLPPGRDWKSLAALPESARFAALCRLCDITPAALSATLRRPNAEAKKAAELLDISAQPLPWTSVECKRLLSRHSAEAIRAAFALVPGGEAVHCLLDAVARSGEPCTLSALAVRGGDLLAAGVPHREVGATLLALLDLVIENPALNTKEMLLQKL